MTIARLSRKMLEKLSSAIEQVVNIMAIIFLSIFSIMLLQISFAMC